MLFILNHNKGTLIKEFQLGVQIIYTLTLKDKLSNSINFYFCSIVHEKISTQYIDKSSYNMLSYNATKTGEHQCM